LIVLFLINSALVLCKWRKYRLILIGAVIQGGRESLTDEEGAPFVVRKRNGLYWVKQIVCFEKYLNVWRVLSAGKSCGG
jgi:hypothetical protein